MGASSSSSQPENLTEPRVSQKGRRPIRILCLHGWRTSGDIMAMQMAAMKANMKRFSFVYINAPLPAKGEPDIGIAMFYPDQPYYEWFYRIDDSPQSDDMKPPSSTDANLNTEINGEKPSSSTTASATKSQSSPRFEGMEETMRYLVEHILNHGPYDGILGFSQGAHMATRLAKLQEDLLDNISKNSSRKDQVTSSEYSRTLAKVKKQLFRFVVLIGGVPPKDLIDSLREKPLSTPSLHIMGTSDPLLNESKTLESLYGPGKGDRKRVMTHAEGHKIPSMATNLYPEIDNWIAQFQ